MKEDSSDLLVEVRQRGVFIISALLWAAAGGAFLILAGYALQAFRYLLELAEKLRQVAGLHPPAQGLDWYLIVVITGILLLLATVGVFLIRWYRNLWRERVEEVWEDSGLRKKHSVCRKLPKEASKDEQEEKTQWLRDFLATSKRSDYWAAMKRKEIEGFPKDEKPATIFASDYRIVSESLLKELEEDIVQRAIATGLIVGIGQSRFFDGLTIVSAALELQFHVLSRLGKRPSLATWREMIKRTAASLLVNTYLNREDTLLVSVGIKQAAIILGASAEALEQAVEHAVDNIESEDLDEIIDTVVDESLETSGGLVSVLGKLGLQAVGLSAGIGAAATRQVAHLIESIGDDLLQGVMAGAIIYFHGMSLAAETLALDQQHLKSEPMERGVMDGITEISATAKRILKEQIQTRRKAYRERRRLATMFKSIKSRI